MAVAKFFHADNTTIPGVNDDAASVEAGVNVPFNELASDFGDAPYWNNGTITSDGVSYMLSVIATFSNMD